MAAWGWREALVMAGLGLMVVCVGHLSGVTPMDNLLQTIQYPSQTAQSAYNNQNMAPLGQLLPPNVMQQMVSYPYQYRTPVYPTSNSPAMGYPQYYQPAPVPQMLQGAPICPNNGQQCKNALCEGDMGCVQQDPSGQLRCACPPPPSTTAAPETTPPPVGSQQWLQQHAVQAPGPSQAAAGMNLATYESGNVALQLQKYLQSRADKAEVKSKIMAIQLKALEKAQPCHLVTLDDGSVQCADENKAMKPTLLRELAGGTLLAGNSTTTAPNVHPLSKSDVNHLASFPLTHSEKKSMDTITEKAAKYSSASSFASSVILPIAMFTMGFLNLHFLS
ncbi:hypothetical protein GUITHDRAFT_148564 [Guillardia theta CCMP2712]|uniref:Uncharacterized protein n=1 Tax=Guillardia theta (strain CCMP2712) TaxID=905079 RepID=L1I8E3_GUITC|nr:hypothetical protein GUITHDRAFT_148564 [Guillardia theta CCMP2712]EKX32541.1 hypothetical protein GUITHDRAFT_148564 [Guillardia theta CCMP2712]|eukprot:XP_005819521.1 hypothetical protein GUITHDRAFT_148564 [Guillardia theta CCMP2712]